MPPTVLDQLATQGGFAVLAAVALYLLYKQSEARAVDLKESASREVAAREETMKITELALAHIKDSSGVMASLNSTLAAIYSIRKLDDTWSTGVAKPTHPPG